MKDLLCLKHFPPRSFDEIRIAFSNAAMKAKMNTPLDFNLTADSLWMPRNHPTRMLNVAIVDSKLFQNFILLVIIVNCVTMALDDPSGADTPLQHAVDNMDYVFLVIFILEMLLKMVAMGLCLHEKAYFRSPWNVLDFVIVIAGIISVIPMSGDTGFLVILRFFRIIRPLRTVSRVPGLKAIIGTLWHSIPMMRDVFLLLGFLMVAFAIFGMHLWSDDVHYRCYVQILNVTSNVTDVVLVQNDTRQCGYRPCETNGITLPQSCMYSPEPIRPVFNFDHFANAVLWVFKMISLDNWPDDAKVMMAATGSYAFLYALLLTVFAGYICLNLTIAVLSEQFAKEENDEEVEETDDSDDSSKICSIMSRGLLFPAMGCMLDIRFKHGDPKLTINRRTVIEFKGNTPEALKRMKIENQSKSYFLDDSQSLDSGDLTVDDVSSETRRKDLEKFKANHQRHHEVGDGTWFGDGNLMLQRYVCSKWFNTFVLCVTFANAVILSTDHYGIDGSLADFVNVSSIVFTIFFLVEGTLKIAALGPRKYVRDAYNWLDAVLCIVSIPDLAGGGGSSFSALRAFRLFRVLRLARNWESLQRLLKTVLVSVKSVAFLSIIMLIVIYIFAILGYQIFNVDVPGMRFSFATVFDSILTVIIIVSGENWSEMMEALMVKMSYGVFVYFIALTIIGNFVLLNLFVAIILENFNQEDVVLPEPHPPELPFSTSTTKDLKDMVKRRKSSAPSVDMKKLEKKSRRFSTNLLLESIEKLRLANFKNRAKAFEKDEKQSVAYEMYLEQKWEGSKHRSLGFLESDSPFRQRVVSIIQTEWFERVMLFCILLSSVFLALDNPQTEDNQPQLSEQLYIFDIIFATIFAIEMLLKIIGLGFWNHPGAYLRDPWNVLDAFVVLTSFVALGYDTFKITRSLRVLKVLSQSAALRLVLTSLIQSIPGMGNVVVLGMLLFWIFGIVGIALFKGQLSACSDSSIETKQDCTGWYNSTTPGIFGDEIGNDTRVWSPLGNNFDHLGQAMLTLVSLAIKDGWFETMYNAVDAQGVDQAPKRNATPANALYFIVFLIVGGFFLINLFVGVLVDRFSAMKAQGEGSAFMTQAQRNWVLAQKVVLRTTLVRPIDPPVHPIRTYMFNLAFHPGFEIFFTIVIIVNCIVLASKYEQQSDDYDTAMYNISLALLSLFTVEVVIKMIAFLPLRYFKEGWNVFDFTVVGLSWIGMGVGGSGASIVRLFRIGRLFMLIKRAKGLQTLLSTLIQAMPAFLNTIVLLLVVYFIFGIIGVQLFGRVPHNGALDNMTNFETVWNALVTLYVVGTSESWMDIMFSTQNSSAVVYFLLFILVGSFIVMNLLVTVVTEAFGEASDAADHSDDLAVFDAFREKWIEYDVKLTHRLTADRTIALIMTLPDPLWVRRTAHGLLVGVSPFVVNLVQLKRLHIPINKQMLVQYKDVVAALALVVFGLRVMDGIDASQKTSEGVTWDKEHFSIYHYYAARRLQLFFFRHVQGQNKNKKYKARKSSGSLSEYKPLPMNNVRDEQIIRKSTPVSVLDNATVTTTTKGNGMNDYKPLPLPMPTWFENRYTNEDAPRVVDVDGFLEDTGEVVTDEEDVDSVMRPVQTLIQLQTNHQQGPLPQPLEAATSNSQFENSNAYAVGTHNVYTNNNNTASHHDPYTYSARHIAEPYTLGTNTFMVEQLPSISDSFDEFSQDETLSFADELPNNNNSYVNQNYVSAPGVAHSVGTIDLTSNRATPIGIMQPSNTPRDPNNMVTSPAGYGSSRMPHLPPSPPPFAFQEDSNSRQQRNHYEQGESVIEWDTTGSDISTETE
eukprot:PhF_6_TR42990/c0_g1_i1/m.65569/K04857/CACNA1S; voltage-dependent calcium channel L type alpha-1S